jgi:hypothetical protein
MIASLFKSVTVSFPLMISPIMFPGMEYRSSYVALFLAVSVIRRLFLEQVYKIHTCVPMLALLRSFFKKHHSIDHVNIAFFQDSNSHFEKPTPLSPPQGGRDKVPLLPHNIYANREKLISQG